MSKKAIGISLVLDDVFENGMSNEGTEMLDAVITSLTEHYTLTKLLSVMEDKTSTADVYEATRLYANEVHRRIDDEEIVDHEVSRLRGELK